MKVALVIVATLLLTSPAWAACPGDIHGTTITMPVGTSENFVAFDNTCTAIVPDAPAHSILTYAFTPNPVGSITSAWTATGVQLTAVAAGSGTLTFFDQGSQMSVSVNVPSPFGFGGITKSP